MKQKRDEITENLYCRTGNSCYFETPNSHNSHSMTCVRIKKEKQYFELVMEAFKAGENGLFGVRFLTHFVSRRGDYRSGKRLNMRKVIPYIASQFRKDKIWLRRTKPSKRQYQIMLAVDDSSSMNDNHSKQVRNEQILETCYKQ